MRLRRTIGSTERFREDPFGQVINFSKKSFSKPEYKLLGYNLNYIPTPNSINKKELAQDIKQFGRRIKLRDHFGNSPSDKPAFKYHSTWEPNENHHTVKTFLEDFSRKVNSELENGPTQDRANNVNTSNNLKKSELEALENIRSMNDVIITKADKGGAIVVQDVDKYIQEAERQLKDRTFYKKLSYNPTSEHEALISNAIDNLKQRELLEAKTAEKLKPTNSNTPKLYLLPKIHKKNNPGRPVVSSVGCPTEKISSFVDHHLQPLNKELPSYVQDTTAFIKMIEAQPEDTGKEKILVTMDVRSLYTNIPNDEGIDAIKGFLHKRARPGDNVLSKVISVFLRLILTLNNFVFNDQNYVQINGCSMGTKCAPPYASLFMGWFENLHILPRINQHISMYVRYIDDIFFIWHGTESELKEFLEVINTVHPTIKFDHKFSRERIEFLDTIVKLENGKLSTTLFTKPTDRRAYLHSNSYHPSSTKRSIAYSQATRLRRICKSDEDFWSHAANLQKDLVNRGYKEETVSSEINRAAMQERSALLTYKEKSSSNRIPLIVTYNRTLPDLNNIVNSTWDHLQINPDTAIKFPEKPIVCYKRNRNLRDLIGQTKISRNKVVRKKEPNRGRCSPCNGRSDCQCCNHIINTTFFTSRTGERYDIRHKTNCRTKNAIYLGLCLKCNEEQYVGKVEQQGTNRRVNKHRNDVARPDGIAIDRHFNQPGHSFNRDFRIVVIEEITKKNLTNEQMRNLLLRREDFWIQKLGTLHPSGFNDKLNFPAEVTQHP
jgi:hypothetical protein